MPEWFLGLLGCSVILAVPVAILIVLVRLKSRVAVLERTVVDQAARLAALERGAPSEGVAPLQTAEPEVAEPEAAHQPPVTEAPPRPDPPDVATVLPAPPRAAAGPVEEPTAAEPPADTTAEPARPAEPVEPFEPVAEPEPTADPDDDKGGWQGIEEALWTRLPVWIGAAALALAGAYLVKLSFDRGWIGPPIRVGLGFAFGGAMLALGEWLRRSSAYVAQGLSAAGVATLYVASYAAVELYDLIPVVVGFLLMVAITAVAVSLSLRQGYVVAVIGLIGGFLTPSLLDDASRSPAVLFAYLLLLQIGLLVVVRRKHWSSLGLITSVAGLLWAFSAIPRLAHGDDAVWIGLFLIASTTTFLAGWVLGDSGDGDLRFGVSLVGWATAGGGLLAGVALASEMDFSPMGWGFVAVLAGGCLVAARLDERRADRLHGIAWMAAMLVGLFFIAWLSKAGHGDSRQVLSAIALFAALFGVGGYLAHFGSRRPGRWASLAAGAIVVFVLMAYGVAPRLGIDDFPGGGLALAAALVLAAAAWPVFRRQNDDPTAARPLAALAAGATTLVSLAVPMELERQWLTVAWAIEIPALVWLARRLRVGALRVMAVLLGVGVGCRLLINPAVLDYPVGSTPIWNALLWLYGVPLLAVIAAAVFDGPRGLGRFGEGLRVLAAGLATALVTLQIRHLVHSGVLGAEAVTLAEWGGWIVAWLAMALLLNEVADRLSSRGVALDRSGRLLLGLVFGAAIVGPVLGANPLWADEPVGSTPIWNRLLWIYGLPIPLLLANAKMRQKGGGTLDRWLARLAQVGALFAAFLLVTLEVRQAFHGDLLHVGEVSTAEQTAYSIAWILLGSLLAFGGVVLGGRLLRFGSLAVLLPAILKVFLVDTSGLDGLWRVASLFGLGVSLFVLAWVYQRFVFRRTG